MTVVVVVAMQLSKFIALLIWAVCCLVAQTLTQAWADAAPTRPPSGLVPHVFCIYELATPGIRGGPQMRRQTYVGLRCGELAVAFAFLRGWPQPLTL